MNPPWVPWALLAPLLACQGACSAEQGSESDEIIRIHGGSDLCVGSVLRISADAARIEEEVGLAFLRPVDVHLGEVMGMCASAALPVDVIGSTVGCAVDGETIAAQAGGGAVSHELVHALRLQHDIRGTPFFEEGLASLIGSGHPSGLWIADRKVLTTPLDLRASATRGWSSHSVNDRNFGGHFMAWASQDSSVSAGIREFLSEEYSEDLEVAFSSSLGVGFDEMEEDWRTASSEIYTSSGRCMGLQVGDLRESGVRVEGTASCDDPGTEGLRSSVLLAGRSCFRLASPGRVRIALQAAHGQLLLQPVDCVDSAQVSVNAAQSDEIAIASCTWSAVVNTDGRSLGRFDYTIDLVE